MRLGNVAGSAGLDRDRDIFAFGGIGLNQVPIGAGDFAIAIEIHAAGEVAVAGIKFVEGDFAIFVFIVLLQKARPVRPWRIVLARGPRGEEEHAVSGNGCGANKRGHWFDLPAFFAGLQVVTLDANAAGGDDFILCLITPNNGTAEAASGFAAWRFPSLFSGPQIDREQR